MRALEGLQSQEERQRQLLESDQREAETALAQLAERQLEIEAEQARIDTLKAEVRSELDRHRQLLAEIERRINEFESEHAHAEEDLARIEREIRSLDSDEGTSPSVLRWPLNSVVTSPFGYRVHPILGTRRLHTGIDLRGSNGTPIGAAGDGTVILARAWGGYGNTVVIDHGGGLTTLYAHQSRVEVSSGAKVSAGQIIGHVGSSGLSTGAHLHFETRVNGAPVDPVQYLP